MIITIPHIKAISIVGQKPTVGSEPLHVIGDDYCSYYVKNHKQQIPAAYLINEVMGHFLLKAWHINTPDIAFVTMPKETITKDYGSLHKKNYYNRLAFGSKEVDGAFDMTEAYTIKGKVDFKKYYQPEIFARIGLFDMWTENEDRATDLKNIMLFEKEERYHFLAIDNAMLFRTGAYNTLTHSDFTGIENNYCLQSGFFRIFKRFLKGLNKDWAKTEEKNFYLCIENSKQHFEACANILPAEWGFNKELENLLTGFLFNDKRNRQVFNEYIRLCS
jgi:hypothetical protein